MKFIGTTFRKLLKLGVTRGSLCPAPASMSARRKKGSHTSTRLLESFVMICGACQKSRPPQPDSLRPENSAKATATAPERRILGMGREQMCVRGADAEAHCFRPFPENTDGVWQPTPQLTKATKIAFGGGHACMIDRGGNVSCWGAGDNGQLGDGAALDPANADCSNSFSFDSSHPSIPRVVGGIHGTDVAAGVVHTCVLGDDGSVRCFGCNKSGELGNGTKTSSSKPVVVNGLGDVRSLAATSYGTCALRNTGTVSCWGQTAEGSPEALTPVEVPNLNDATQIAAGSNFVCAVTHVSSVVCWGEDWATHQVHNTPARVGDLKDVVQLEASVTFACARIANGTVRCWGERFGGELGDGLMANAVLPTTVVDVRDAVELRLGGAAGCALNGKNELWCWGSERPRPPLPEVDGVGVDQFPWKPVPIAF